MNRESLVKKLNDLTADYYEKFEEYPFMYGSHHESEIYEFADLVAVTNTGNKLITIDDMERLLSILGKEVIATKDVDGNNCKDKTGVVVRVSVMGETVRAAFHGDDVDYSPWYLRGKEFRIIETERTKHILEM